MRENRITAARTRVTPRTNVDTCIEYRERGPWTRVCAYSRGETRRALSESFIYPRLRPRSPLVVLACRFPSPDGPIHNLYVTTAARSRSPLPPLPTPASPPCPQQPAVGLAKYVHVLTNLTLPRFPAWREPGGAHSHAKSET